MGLLDGGIAAVMGAAFSGVYLPATLYGASGPIYDGNGNITGYDAGEQSCRAQIDRLDWRQRGEAGTEGEVSILILTAGLASAPTDDSSIMVEAPQYAKGAGYQRWALSALTLDPAGSHWTAVARKAD